jgi:hypothetical protein
MWIKLSSYQNVETECHGPFVAIYFAADFGNRHLLRACRTRHNRRGLVFFLRPIEKPLARVHTGRNTERP